MISFEKMWPFLQSKGISQYSLIHDYQISPSQISRLKNNENVTTYTINRFCKLLDCDITDIMEYKKD